MWLNGIQPWQLFISSCWHKEKTTFTFAVHVNLNCMRTNTISHYKTTNYQIFCKLQCADPSQPQNIRTFWFKIFHCQSTKGCIPFSCFRFGALNTTNPSLHSNICAFFLCGPITTSAITSVCVRRWPDLPPLLYFLFYFFVINNPDPKSISFSPPQFLIVLLSALFFSPLSPCLALQLGPIILERHSGVKCWLLLSLFEAYFKNTRPSHLFMALPVWPWDNKPSQALHVLLMAVWGIIFVCSLCFTDTTWSFL